MHNRRDRGRKRLEMTDLVANCIAIARDRMHLPEEAMVLEPPPPGSHFPVIGTDVELNSAILNLLDNAVKYSGESIHIRVRLRIERDVWVMLDVRDQGIGIAQENLTRIFKRFYRVQSRSAARIIGTGLGLFIVRSIARQHGGDATAASDGPGKGSTMTLKLPLAPPPASDAAFLPAAIGESK
jgi:signal transduction histidine kinase